MDDWNWWWKSEIRRDEMLREAIEGQAAAAVSLRSQLSKQSKTFERDLKALRGNLDKRLTALTSAFLSYVQLDEVENQLQAFSGHPEARSHALRNIKRLAEGLEPEPRTDIPDYWLVPAVAALHPDGHLDESLAEQARLRNPDAAWRFLSIAEAALGRGPAVVHDLPRLLQPDDTGVWQSWQQLVWRAVALGCYGPDALQVLTGTLDAVLDGSEDKDWVNWVRTAKQEKASNPVSEADAVSWVLDQFEAVTSAPEPEVVEEEATGERVDPRELGRTMLLKVLTQRVVGSNEEEDALLAEMVRIRQEFTQALGQVSPGSDLVSSSEPHPFPALLTIQGTVLDEELPSSFRAQLWRQLLPRFRSLAEGFAVETAPTRPEISVEGYPELRVDPDGLLNSSKLKAIRARIEREQSPQGIANQWLPILLCGVVGLVVSVGLASTRSPFVLLLLLASLVTTPLGFYFRSNFKTQQDGLHTQLSQLDNRVTRATKQAASRHRTDQKNWERKRELAERFKQASSGLRRLPG